MMHVLQMLMLNQKEEGRTEGWTAGQTAGIAQGRSEGRQELTDLLKSLLAHGKQEDIRRVIEDQEYQDALLGK